MTVPLLLSPSLRILHHLLNATAAASFKMSDGSESQQKALLSQFVPKAVDVINDFVNNLKAKHGACRDRGCCHSDADALSIRNTFYSRSLPAALASMPEGACKTELLTLTSAVMAAVLRFHCCTAAKVEETQKAYHRKLSDYAANARIPQSRAHAADVQHVNSCGMCKVVHQSFKAHFPNLASAATML